LLADKIHGNKGRVGLRERFVRGVSWNLIGTFLAQGSVFAANIIVANHLGARSFGEFSLLQNTALTFSAIAQVATGLTATRYISEYRVSDPERAGRIIGFCSLFTLGTGLLAGLLLFALAGWLSAATLKAPHLSDGLKIMALYLVFSAMSGYQTGVLAGLERYQQIARLGAIHGGIHITCCAASVWSFGLPGALWALVASLAARWWLYHLAIREEVAIQSIKLSYVMEKQESSFLWRFSIPAALGGFTSMPALWLANTFLVQHPDGYKQLGLYSVAFSLKTAVMMVPAAFNTVGGSIINNELSAKDDARYRQAFWSNTTGLLASALLGAGAIIISGHMLLGIFGPDFVSAYEPLIIMMLATLPEALSIGFYQLIQTQERMWWSLMAVSIPRDGIMILVAYFLAFSSGATGVAVAYLTGWTVALLVIAFKAYCIGIAPGAVLNSPSR
jgi:O-antigen/teichoic acid export membrane protein